MLYIFLFLTMTIMNIIGLTAMRDYKLTQILFNKKSINIEYKEIADNNKDLDIEKELIAFSYENSINILRYEFLDDTKVNIYTTNLEKEKKIKLSKGEFPEGKEYLSNLEEGLKQSGMFFFPISNWTVHVYEFSQIKNVGLGSEFYLRGANKEIVDKFIKEFSKYGDITIRNSSVQSFVLMSKELVLLGAVTMILFLIILVAFIISKQKELILKQIWGYKLKKMRLEILKKIIIIVGVYFSLILMLLIGFSIYFHQIYFLKENILVITIMTLLLVVIMGGVTYFFSGLVLRLGVEGQQLKGNLPFRKIQVLAMISKILITYVFVFLISLTLSNIAQTNERIEGMKYWDKAKGVFRITYTTLNETIDSDMLIERDLNKRSFDFYKAMEKNKKAFLINAENFGSWTQEGVLNYFYQYNTTGDEVLYSPRGRSIIINRNYLQMNPIKTTDGSDLIVENMNEENKMIILVPEKLRKYEAEIRESYRKEFYFRKVEIDNIYREASGYELNCQPMEELSIRILYVKNNQSYFTYSAYLGDYRNQVVDPIVIIHNEYWDNSDIGAMVTSSLFFKDDSGGEAYDGITGIIKESNMPEIRRVESVYGEANGQIVRLRSRVFQQSITLVIVTIFSVLSIIIMVWSYYRCKAYELGVKYMFGYSDWMCNKSMIIVVLATDLSAGLLGVLRYKMGILFLIVLIYLLLELILIKTLSTYLCKKNIKKIIKRG